METLDRPTFETEASKEIYQFVERHGTAARHRVRDMVELPAEEFREELERLTTNGYLEEEGGTLRVVLDAGSVERYASGDLTYSIRPARADDFDQLIDTIRDVTESSEYVVAESIAEQLLYEDTIVRHNTVESRVFFMAAHNDDILGWTHLDLPQIEKLQNTVQVTVGVREAYRGRGIGSRLLERALEWAKANGYRKAYNSIPAINDEAIAFLEAHDWHTEGIRRDHYTLDGTFVDEVMMAVEL
ncbi:GNAT family N-acetyltransferase [Halogeometricum borinquense]|uniref:GNAT family N-acetyltransferase n=1 Tax=Halogeometricum borinquense TaxID=60847 RepID=A0A482T7Q9_9EURY|nr:GNAT family N-acetyltransferase [Halogeometricum borinquense]RYJ12847.1 GNAT family N-acetyltransferase [Halogeometricum borinquense]